MYVGGLVGANDVTIENSYSTATVTGGNAVGGFFLWAPDYVKERALRAEEAMTADEDRVGAINAEAGGRIEFWKTSLQITAEHPIIGVGYGQISRHMYERTGRVRPSRPARSRASRSGRS